MKKSKLIGLGCALFLIFMSATSSTAQWVPVASPPADFITDHTYGFGLDGKGYLVTGTDENGNIRDDFYQYDPITDEFTQLDPFPGGARGFAIGDTWDGKAYFGFGSSSGPNGIKDDLWVFDPSTMTWTELASCPCIARRHPAFIAHNDKIFLGLGSSGFGDLNDWWIYDIPTDTWTEGPDLPSPPRHHPYQFGIGDYVYVGFGHGGPIIYNTWYRFDPANNQWTQIESLPGEGRVAGQQFSYNGKGYALSGEGEDHNAMEEGEFWSYDPLTLTWEQLPSHPGTSRWAPASFVIGSEIYIFNGVVYGFGPPTSMSDAFKYDMGPVMSSTENVENKFDLKIHPNPASDYLFIEGKGDIILSGNFRLFNVLGNELMRFEVDGKKTLDISGLNNGIYLISDEGNSNTWRFVVSR